jgi:nicotinic acid mononucleotide adenylyltransferase
MIAFDALKEYRGRVAMVDGAFDPLHRGHIEYFRAAAELGLPLLCNLQRAQHSRGTLSVFEGMSAAYSRSRAARPARS